jgi:prephenate dehydrogenase
MFNRVAIVGMGLIGGSMGLALHKIRAAQRITGYDSGSGVCEQAQRTGVIDESSDRLVDVVSDADLVILATPVGAMNTILKGISSALSPGAIVTDVASTKTQVVSWAEQLLPANVSFIGGHPMAGKEVSGVEAADAELFKNCIYCLTPTSRTDPSTISKMSSLIEMLGARQCFLSPHEHDKQVASVSHLPFLASVALMTTVANDVTWNDASFLAATGFRDVTRLAGGSPAMYRDICLTNSTAIIEQLDTYISTLSLLRERIAKHDQDIDEVFSTARRLRQQWQEDHNTTE